MLGKLKSMINRVALKVARVETGTENFFPAKGVMARFSGNVLNPPTMITSYNVFPAVRTGVGVYVLLLQQTTILGKTITVDGVFSSDSVIQPTLNTDLFTVTISPVSVGSITINVSEVIQGPGNNLSITPYDIIVGDTIKPGIVSISSLSID